MTWIYDDTGKHWVEPTPRKQRKPARAVRFAEVKVDDQLVQSERRYDDRKIDRHWIVVAVWFDPVAGYYDREAGNMVAVQRINEFGIGQGLPARHTRRGLASQGYRYSKVDYIDLCRARIEALKAGTVVGIGAAKRIKKHPSFSKPL